MNNLLLDFRNSFLYDGVSHESEGFHSCAEYGCADEGICRCYQIEKVTITSVNIDTIAKKIMKILSDKDEVSKKREDAISTLLYGHGMNEINDYCVRRLLSVLKIWRTDIWEVQWGDNYYGEEVEKISLQESVFEKLVQELDVVLGMDSLDKKINHLLELEYGFVDRKLEGKSYMVEKVSIENIVFPHMSHHKIVQKKDLEFYNERRYPNQIRGIVVFDGENYRVVDGYHRLTYAQKFKKKVVKVLVAK